MRPGDVILQIDRHDVDSAHAAAAVLAKATPPILLLVKRGESTVFLTLTARQTIAWSERREINGAPLAPLEAVPLLPHEGS